MNGTLMKPEPRESGFSLAEFRTVLRIAFYLALSDVRARYKRSVLGPLWITLGATVGTFGLGLLWSQLFHMQAEEFVPSLTVGLILWLFISGILVDAPTVFVRQASTIRNVRQPLYIYPLQLVIRHLINLAHNLPILLVVWMVYGISFEDTSWMALPAVAVLTLTLFAATVLLGFLGARFRDLEHIVAMVMPILMFLSPVFYRPSYLTLNKAVIWANPISHWIELVRYPLLGEAPSTFLMATNGALLLACSLLAFWLYRKKHRNLVFWL